MAVVAAQGQKTHCNGNVELEQDVLYTDEGKYSRRVRFLYSFIKYAHDVGGDI